MTWIYHLKYSNQILQTIFYLRQVHTKAMDLYNYFVSGFVKEVGAKVFSNICLLVARVSHSPTLSERPPTSWVIAEMGGKVLSAHCNCMSELGEDCSHIGAILFYCRAATEKKDSITVTG